VIARIEIAQAEVPEEPDELLEMGEETEAQEPEA
jgi:hypothetical protein